MHYGARKQCTKKRGGRLASLRENTMPKGEACQGTLCKINGCKKSRSTCTTRSGKNGICGGSRRKCIPRSPWKRRIKFKKRSFRQPSSNVPPDVIAERVSLLGRST
ncbi:hypothetical protein M493_18502 (plasmid) [Geobacillus genomosp. 3]|uniref:Uncharacterized protein n=1 Tax=Geobacillus genomosp. 3 TaxID=1921421 RepID=V5LVT3_GEOG3|nr:hypothetical protein M493_18502 [Geobacillus genomosp. 3]